MRRHQPWLVVVVVGAVLGIVFAAVSTYDFVQHLDRQVHNLHCSFVLGVSHGGESGCQVAMMSPYSSVLRSHLWGGVPISLPAMSVFAFLVFYALDLLLTRRKDDPRATGFLALACVLPAATSLVMLIISLTQLGTTCKLCVGIYLASATCLVGALVAWRQAARAGGGGVAPAQRDEPAFLGRAKSSGARLIAVDTQAASAGFLAAAFAVGVAFVALPLVLYLAMAPDHARFIGTCEALPRPDDTYGVMLRVDRPGSGGVPAIEVLDPLCPACKAFEHRLAASGLAPRLDRKAVLFPLDNTCNWMVTEATHPGACTVSEAVLCAGDRAPEVIAWAFEVQDRIRSETKADPAAAARIIKQRFPDLASCVGSPEARSRLNKSLRWIVANNIRVLTPQLFIDKVKMCDEDVDLGLEYTLANMLDRHARGTLAPVPLEKPAPDAAGTRAGGRSGPGERPADSASSGRTSSDKAASDTTPDKAASDRTPSDKASSDRTPSDKADKPASDKPASDKPASDKAASDKPASDKPASDKAASDKPASDKPDKAAADRSADDKMPAEAPAGGKPAEHSGADVNDSVPVAPPAGSNDKAPGKRGDIELPSADPRGSGGSP